MPLSEQVASAEPLMGSEAKAGFFGKWVAIMGGLSGPGSRARGGLPTLPRGVGPGTQ
jgi:hypothetical protein